MRRGRIFFVLAFVLILGLAGVLIVWRLMGQTGGGQKTPVAQVSRLTNVVVVTQRVPRGQLVKEEMLDTIPWDKTAVISDTMFFEGDIPEIVGRQAKYDIEAQVPLFKGMLVDPEEQLPTEGSPAALNIPPGMVAVSVPVSRLTSVAYGVRAGDHVNVVASMLMVDMDTDFQTIMPNYTGLVIASGPADPETKERDPLTAAVASLMPAQAIDPETGEISVGTIRSPGIAGKVEIDPVLGQAIYLTPSEAQRPRLVSQMILQDVVVLQMGTFNMPGQQAAEQQQQQQAAADGEEAPKVVLPDIVTLIVSPQDAVTLNYAMLQNIFLSLALRSAGDNSRTEIVPVTLQFLLEQYQIPVPVKLPYAIQPRIDALNPPILFNDLETDTKKK